MLATAADAPEVARLHAENIRGGFLSSLGPAFLRRLYRGILEHPGSAVFVARCGGRVVGFAAVTSDTRAMYRWVLRHRSMSLGLSVGLNLLRPTAVRRILETLWYPSDQTISDLPPAEMLALAVDPDARRGGIGTALYRARLDWLHNQGVAQVRVACTDGLPNNRLIRRLGFELVTCKSHHGAKLNLYVRACRALCSVGAPSPQ